MFEPVDVIGAESSRLAAVVAAADDLAAPVPGCPEWSLVDLAAHVGTVQRYWTEVIRTGERPEVQPVSPPVGTTATDLADWYRASADGLVAAIRCRRWRSTGGMPNRPPASPPRRSIPRWPTTGCRSSSTS